MGAQNSKEASGHGSESRRLSVMMFLEYVIWGSWLPLLALYLSQFLHFSGGDIGWIFATQAVASLTGIFISGQLADRYFSTERFLAISHLIGGLAMFALAQQKTFWPFFVTMLVYMVVYVPTLSLTNSICFHHLKNAQDDFGRVRLWGTIGWIAASWPFVFILKGKAGPDLEAALGAHLHGGRPRLHRARGVLAAAAQDAALGRRAAGERALRGDQAPREPRRRDPVRRDVHGRPRAPVLLPVDEPVPGPHRPARELDHAGHEHRPDRGDLDDGGPWLLPEEARLAHDDDRRDPRATCCASSSTRSASPVWLVVGSNVVHGFCYAFFFASVYIFVDEYFPKDARASAQGLFNLLILGARPVLRQPAVGQARRRLHDGRRRRLPAPVPGARGLGLAAVLLFVGFHPDRTPPAVEKAA